MQGAKLISLKPNVKTTRVFDYVLRARRTVGWSFDFDIGANWANVVTPASVCWSGANDNPEIRYRINPNRLIKSSRPYYTFKTVGPDCFFFSPSRFKQPNTV